MFIVLFAVAILALIFLTNVNNTIKVTERDEAPSTAVVNETVTWSNGTFVAFAKTATDARISCSNVYNNAAGGATTPANQTIGTGNYTCTDNGINLTTASENITTTVLVDYTHKPFTAEYNVTDRGETGMFNISAQFGNMGTIIAVVIIIGMLLSAFLLRRPGP